MNDWDKLIEQPVSDKHARAVKANMDSLLDQNAALAAGEQAKGRGWLFWLAPLGGLAAAALAFTLVTRETGTVPETATLARAPMLELALEFELLSDLREIQHLEELQKLGDKEWTARKSATRNL